MRLPFKTLAALPGAVLAIGFGTGLAQEAPSLTSLQAAPDGGGARRWQVVATSELRASPGGEVRVTLESGAIAENLGCVVEDGAAWCQLRVLDGDAKGFVLAEGLEGHRGPDGKVATGRDDSQARVRRRDFDAKTELPCAQEQGQALAPCPAAIARSGGGDATVEIRFPNDFARLLFFEMGAFVKASTTMSGTGRDIAWEVTDGTYLIRVDDQRFEIPEAFVLGTAKE